MPKAPKIGERHHWWPGALSQYWKNGDGIAHQLMNDGRVTPLQPYKFGFIRDGHNILFGGSVWDSTIEPIFDRADASFSSIEKFLRSEATDLAAGEMSGASFPDGMRDLLAEAIVSLVIRSPQFRNKVKITVESYSVPAPSRMGNLIAANINQSYCNATRVLKSGGKFMFLYSREAEFIYGDGHLHNIGVGDTSLISTKIVMPILPELCIIYSRPMSMYTEPQIVKMQVSADDVRRVNNVTQVYSSRFLFFRSQKPIITPEFKSGDFLEFQYHEEPLVEWLIGEMVRYRGKPAAKDR